MEQIKEKIKEIVELIAQKIIEGKAESITFNNGWYNLKLVVEEKPYSWIDETRIEISVNPESNLLQSHNYLIQSKYFEPYKEEIIKAALDKYTKKRREAVKKNIKLCKAEKSILWLTDIPIILDKAGQKDFCDFCRYKKGCKFFNR